MSEEYEEQSVYVLLDFQNKDMSKLLKQQSVYFRMLNLNETKPVVELGDDIYEGTYHDAIGTNVFFEEIENPQQPDLFEGETPISLKYLLKQSKVLKLKHIGTKPKLILNQCAIEPVNIYVKDDYRVLLDKIKNDELNIEDYITDSMNLVNIDNTDSDSKHSDEEVHNLVQPLEETNSGNDHPPKQSLESDWYLNKNSTDKENVTYNKYLKLLKLVDEPRKPEVIENEHFIFNGPMDFCKWKSVMLQVVEQQHINVDVNKHNIEHFVNVEESIKQGIINGPHSTTRVFTPEEKQTLFSFKNFVNLSPLMKLVILNDCLNFEKAEVENLSEAEMNTEDENHYTPLQKIQLLSDFKEELKAHIISRIKDAKRSESSLKTVNVSINLSDEEDSYEQSSDYGNSESGNSD